jgi:ATP-dependent 26S proteasome regulatory subunit
MKFSELLASYFVAGYPIVNVQTSEEPRLEAAVKETLRILAERPCTDPSKAHMWQDSRLIRWDVSGGAKVYEWTGSREGTAHPCTNPVAFLDQLVKPQLHNGFSITVAKNLLDFAAADDNIVLRRKIQNLIHQNGFFPSISHGSGPVQIAVPIVVVSGSKAMHPDLQQLIPTLEFGLPNEQEIAGITDFIAKSAKRDLPGDLREKIMRNIRGLTQVDAENVLARALAIHGPTPALLDVLKEEKARIAKDIGSLTYISEDVLRNISPLGGFEGVLEHVELHAVGFKPEARAVGIPYPKGIALAGPPGTGKSHLAKLIGKMLDMPTYFFDIASVFSALVGSSEQNVKKALEIVEAQEGAVIVLDELDKAIGGVHKSSNDSGVGKRVVGKILTWLTERKSPTYVIATLNRIGDVPPEFLRAGRFDACFCTSLPDIAARKDIFRIHLQKRKCGDTLDMLRTNQNAANQLMQLTDGFVGSEIETVVEESILHAYRDTGHTIPSPEILLSVAAEVKPLSKTAGDDIAQQQKYMEDGWLRPVHKTKAVERAERSRNIG